MKVPIFRKKEGSTVTHRKKHPITSLLAMLLVLPVLLAICTFVLPPQFSETFLGEMAAKQQLLQNTPGRRVILIGGSSVPFALDSERLAQELPGWSVVDYGLYADLGTVTMLDWARDDIRPGDLVVLAPEQNSQALSCRVGGDSLWQACDGCFSMLLRLHPSRWETALAALPAFAGKKLHYFLTGRPEAEGIYLRDSFLENGDIRPELRQQNILPLGYQTEQPIFFDPDILSEDFVEEVNTFAAFVRSQGAEIVYHFSPMNASALSPKVTRKAIDGYYDSLSKKLDMPILGNPHNAILESGWFYDSNFHLNAAGSLRFTRLLAEDLKLYWKDTTPTNIPIPQMPAPLQRDFAGDSSCEDCFAYRRTDTGWIAEGLTEQGRSASRLILPSSHNGLPVVGFDAGLFRGNVILEELIIQPNIPAIPDGFAEGCIRLRALILTGSPTDYSIGQGLLNGAGFQICVPSESLTAYRRSYFWQQYAARIQQIQ